MAKTWQQKLHIDRKPEIEVLEKPFGGMLPGARMLISTPLEVQEEVRRIPEGELTDIAGFRARLAKRHKADGTCPLTASIFLRIVAECALEEHAAGKPWTEVAPFWRAVEPKSPLAKKLSCGPDLLAQLRTAEQNTLARPSS